MVKVQKPNPKTLKKDVPEKAKNVQMKKSKPNATKEKVKQIEKTLENVAKNKVAKDVKPKSDVLNKNSKKVQQKDQKAVQKKQPTVAKIENKSQNVNKKFVQKKEQTTVAKAENKTQNVVKKVVQKTVGKAENKTQNVDGEIKKNKKKKQIYDPVNFDEKQFKTIVTLENIKKISEALKTLVEKEVSEKKTSIFSDYKYFLNISSFKIPTCPKRMVKLNVKHSLVDTKNDDVVIIVPDLQRGAKVDYEPTIQHYEDLLRENGVDDIKVVPFNQLRNECTTFESKRKFANTYDYFLCDGRIVGHVVGFLGKHFQKPRSTIHAVRMDDPKTHKIDVEHALKRTSYKQLHKGDLVSIPVGNHRFTITQLAENIKMVIDQLKDTYAGGYANMRNIYLKIDIKGTSSLPLYVSLTGAPQEIPNVIGPREQRMLKLKKQANDILSKFSMSKTGEFVKLNKTQVERKQQIREARTALLSNEPVEEDNDNEFKPAAKKVKKDKQIEVASKSEDENEESDANEEGSEVSDEE
ncbi:ribosomal L1 domain-containing protein CG13096 [Calliphora vicina]|uniref:ribosomal L1 domain-containing protein CG13096 n=1 Tax=Calliphora vicina TaxID=7373 RepID=UPI00325BA0D2